MTEHRIKINIKWYDAVKNGIKTFEVRKNDRDYKVGDTITFKVVDGQFAKIPDNELYAITYILAHEDFPDGIKEGYVVMSLKRVE